MPAQLSESPGSAPHHLRLPTRTDGPLGAVAAVEQALAGRQNAGSEAEGLQPNRGMVCLDAGRWCLDGRQLDAIEQLLHRHGLALIRVQAERAETRVAAAALGLDITTPISLESSPVPLPATGADLKLHRGTLRAGDHLEVEGSVLLLGDVNPGASIRATGHVLVWGRLRGTAHAGTSGDEQAKIVALQLRPLQLRIGARVARGPDGAPPQGLAEEAAIVDGAIQIRPAAPSWPLSD